MDDPAAGTRQGMQAAKSAPGQILPGCGHGDRNQAAYLILISGYFFAPQGADTYAQICSPAETCHQADCSAGVSLPFP